MKNQPLTCCTGSRNEEQLEANACLMAAAPDMLQALKDVDKAYQDMFAVMPVAFQTVAYIVEAAINRAEGRE